MGWTAILVPEEYAGLEYGFTGMGIVLEESGRTLTPSPLLGTALAGAAALIKAGTPGQCSEILPLAGERCKHPGAGLRRRQAATNLAR